MWTFGCPTPEILGTIFFDSKMSSNCKNHHCFKNSFFLFVLFSVREEEKRNTTCSVPTNCETYPDSKIITSEPLCAWE